MSTSTQDHDRATTVKGGPAARPMLYTSYGSEMALLNTGTKRVMVGAAAHPRRRHAVHGPTIRSCTRPPLRRGDRGDRAEPHHRVRRTGVARPRVLPRRSVPTRRPSSVETRTGGRSGSASRRSARLAAGGRHRGGAGRRAGRPARHPAARAVPGPRHAGTGLHRRVLLQLVDRAQRRHGHRSRLGGAGALRRPAQRDRPELHQGPEAVLARVRAAGHLRPGGPQHRPVAGGPGVHGHPRPGHRGRRHGGQPGPVQDDGVRGVLVLRRLLRGPLFYRPPASSRPSAFNLELAVLFIAMVLVGGAGTISGAILGAFFFTLLPQLTRELPGTCRSSAARRPRHPTCSSWSSCSTARSSSCS